MELLNKQIAPATAYPEKVLQFGTGVLLRGLPDYFIEKANRKGLFNGSILVVKSTAGGEADLFQAQDNRYTIHINGQEQGQPIAETLVVSVISRVVSANDGWESILDAAASPDMKLVISNTTEVGIVLDEADEVNAAPPRSFPGKLTACLYHRYKAFGGDPQKGLVILPTELIDKNGEQLRAIVLRLAQLNNLPDAFNTWVQTANTFCNTLVDRIVPGRLPETDRQRAESLMGYRDELAIMAEPFRLWAIEVPDERTKTALSFAAADQGVVLASDITRFKELKLRLLNGTHTFSCALALLGGWATVKEAMQDTSFSRYIRNLLNREIVPSLSAIGIDALEAQPFADSVIDRFANPSLDHLWESISLNYTSKMKMRNMETIVRYTLVNSTAPKYMALGFAAYLLLLRDRELNDPVAVAVCDAWTLHGSEGVVDAVLRNQELWEINLSAQGAFRGAVKQSLSELMEVGVRETIEVLTGKK